MISGGGWRVLGGALNVMSPRREAYSHAEWICARLPRRLQEIREARGKTMYLLARESGVSRDMIGCIESRQSIPTVHVLARLAHALEVSLEVLFGRVEERGSRSKRRAAVRGKAKASDISD